MHPAIRAIKRSTTPQYSLLGNFAPNELLSTTTQLVTITTSSFILTNPLDMRMLMSVELFQVFPASLIAMAVIPSQQQDSQLRDIIFSIDADLVIRIVEIDKDLQLKTSVYDCNLELPYGMKPRLKTILYCGAFEQNVFILFENLLYMIVDINESKITTFTVSELTSIDANEDIIDVATHFDQVQILTSIRCHVFKAQIGEYFSKELYKEHKFVIEDPVKIIFGSLVASFDSIQDPINQVSVPIDIFVTNVLKLKNERWFLLDKEQMTGYVYPEMKRVVLQVESSGMVYSFNDMLVVIGEHTICSFETDTFQQLAQQSMLIPTITNVLQTERELLLLSKTHTNSSLSFLQQDYYLDKLTEGKEFGEVRDMWTFKNQESQHQFLMVSSELSSHIFKLSSKSQTKVGLTIVEEQEQIKDIIKDESTLIFNEHLDTQITQQKILSKGQVIVESDHVFEAAAIGNLTCAVLSVNLLQIYELATGTSIQSIKNEGNDEIQSFDYLKETDSLLISHWNSNLIEVRDVRSWDLLSQIDVADYAPYVSLEIDQVATGLVSNAHFLFVGLRNGTLLIFDVYPQVLQKKLSISNQAPVRLQQAKNVGFIKLRNFSRDAAVIFCENNTFIASINQDAKQSLHDLVLKPIGETVNNLVQLGDVAVSTKDGIINLCCLDGPAFGQSFKQRQVVVQPQYHIQQVIMFQNFVFATVYSQQETFTPALLVISPMNAKIVQKITFDDDYVPSAITCMDSRVYVGLTLMNESARQKTQIEDGNIVSYIFDGFQLTRERSIDTFGAVIDLCCLPKQKKIVAGVNQKLVCFDEDLLFKVCQIESQILIFKIKASEDESEILVADLIKSLTVYNFQNSNFIIKSRYPNGQWCFDMTPVGIINQSNCYLSCDFDKNLLFLENNEKALLSLQASYNLKEQVNSSLVLKQDQHTNDRSSQRLKSNATNVFISPSYLQTQVLPRDQSFFAQGSDDFESVARACLSTREILTGSSDGGLHKIQLLNKRVAATLLSLQDQLHQDYAKFSKVSIKGETKQTAGMANLDLIQQFLALPDQKQVDLTDGAMQAKREGAMSVTTCEMRFLVALLK